MSHPNRYKGDCKTCGVFVPAGDGVYNNGMTTCTAQVPYSNGMAGGWYCLPAYNTLVGMDCASVDDACLYESERRQTAQAQSREQVRLGLVNGRLTELAITANVRSLEQVIAKVVGDGTVSLADLTWEQACRVRVELEKRIDRKLASARRDDCKASDTCTRCGGAGRSDKWMHTGHLCYQCGGTGKYNNQRRAK